MPSQSPERAGAAARPGVLAGFRAFRTSRPFWAGVFAILGGIEILLLPLSPLASLVLLGVAGISSVLMGGVLVVMGLFMWFSPPNRTLAGVLTLLFSLASFVTSNLGGLIVGMVLGLVGGALCLAWTPKARGPRTRRRFPWSRGPRSGGGAGPAADGPADLFDGPAADTGPIRPATPTPRPGRRRPLRPDEYPDGYPDGVVPPDLAPPAEPPSPRPRHQQPEFRFRPALGRAAGCLALVTAICTGAALSTPGVAAADTCLLGVICSAPPPTPAAAPTSAPTSGAEGTTTSSDGTATGSGSGSATGPPPSAAAPSAAAPSTAPGGVLGQVSDALNGAASTLPLPTLPALAPGQLPVLGSLLPQLIDPVLPTVPTTPGVVVSGRIGTLTMDTLTVTNFRFLGVVTYPVATGGTMRALRIVVDSTDIGNLGVVMPGPEGTMLVNQVKGAPHASSPTLVLDVTRLSIKAFGVLPLEFSFAFPPPPLITIPALSGTDVDIDFVTVQSDLTAPRITVATGPASTGPATTDPTAPTMQTSGGALVQLASLLKLPTMLVPYGLSPTQAQQAVADYDKNGTTPGPAPAPAAAAPPAPPGPAPNPALEAVESAADQSEPPTGAPLSP